MFVQYLAGVISDRITFKIGKRKPFILGGAILAALTIMLLPLFHNYPFLAAGFLGIVSVLIGTIPIKENTSKYTKPSKISIDFIKYSSVLMLFASVFFVFLSYGCITPYFVKYCVQQLHFTNQTASTGLFVLTIAGALFTLPAGIISDKVDRRFVLFLGAVIFAVALVLATFVNSVQSMYIVLALVGIGFICIQVTIYAILAEIAPPERLGEFMGIMNLFISLSQWIATLTMGWILDSVSFKYFFPISSSIMFIAAIVILFSRFNKFNSQNKSEVEKYVSKY